jgi:glycine/D-amino acid oxidase-like deaminating enzyme
MNAAPQPRPAAAGRRPRPTAAAVGPLPRRRGQATTTTAAAAAAASPAGATPPPAVIVLGGGVIGWATALAVAHLPARPAVTIVAADFDDTTSHGAGGLWEPYKCGDTPAHLVNRWGGSTLDHLRAVYASAQAGPAGVAEVAVFQLWSAGGPSPSPPDPAWAAVVPHFRRLDRGELDAWESVAASHAAPGEPSPPPRAAYSAGWTFWSAVAQPSRYLPWLAARARGAGVRQVTARVIRLEDLATGGDGVGGRGPAAAIVNCAGLGARDLVADAALHPVRGQVARLAAPGVKSAVFVDEGTYIIPNVDFCVVGGTAQVGDEDVRPREVDRAAILARAERAVPGLAGAPGCGDWAGLRPVRTTVRLEVDGAAASVPVIHNYGHGGSGVTLHWGCAADAAALVARVLEERILSSCSRA